MNFYFYFLLGIFFYNYFISSLFMIIIALYGIKMILSNQPLINKLKKNKIEKNAKISIIIPIYNEEVNLPKLINSILLNDTENIEFIFVNDSSTDKSLKILKESKVNYFKIVDLQKQKLVCNVLNEGLKVANKYSDFIGVINGDCHIDSDCFRKVKFRLNNYDINALNLNNTTKNNTNFVSKIASMEKSYKSHLFVFNESSLNNGYFISRNLFNKWDTITEDQNLALVIKKNGSNIYQDPNINIYDSVPNSFTKLMSQKYRWIYGDMYNRFKFKPQNIFDIIVSIYYLFPLYSITTLLTLTYQNNYILNIQSIIILIEIVLFLKSKKYRIKYIPLAIFYGIYQFTFQIYFYAKFIYSKFLNLEVKW